MYKKHDLTLTGPCTEMHDNWDEPPQSNPHFHVYGHFEAFPYPVVYLEHSCDEWVIGGVQEVQAMIDDLTDILAQLKTL